MFLLNLVERLDITIEFDFKVILPKVKITVTFNFKSGFRFLTRENFSKRDTDVFHDK